MDALTLETKQAIADASARSLIWALSGRRFGVFETLAEPYRVNSCGGGSAFLSNYMSGGTWYSTCSGGCCKLNLVSQPVREILEVRVNGAAVDASGYNLTANTLTIAGGCSTCEGCANPSIEVDYRWGIPMPLAGIGATAELACEFMNGMNGDPCRLSARAVQIVRQGVTVSLKDAGELAAMGLTGLPITDAFINSVNPNHLMQRPFVISPDLPRRGG